MWRYIFLVIQWKKKLKNESSFHGYSCDFHNQVKKGGVSILSLIISALRLEENITSPKDWCVRVHWLASESARVSTGQWRGTCIDWPIRGRVHRLANEWARASTGQWGGACIDWPIRGACINWPMSGRVNGLANKGTRSLGTRLQMTNLWIRFYQVKITQWIELFSQRTSLVTHTFFCQTFRNVKLFLHETFVLCE